MERDNVLKWVSKTRARHKDTDVEVNVSKIHSTHWNRKLTGSCVHDSNADSIVESSSYCLKILALRYYVRIATVLRVSVSLQIKNDAKNPASFERCTSSFFRRAMWRTLGIGLIVILATRRPVPVYFLLGRELRRQVSSQNKIAKCAGIHLTRYYFQCQGYRPTVQRYESASSKVDILRTVYFYVYVTPPHWEYFAHSSHRSNTTQPVGNGTRNCLRLRLRFK